MNYSEFFDSLWPICRSITGPGLRQSLEIVRQKMPIQIYSKPTGQEVFDWTIPDEWRIKDAYLIGPDGVRYCDFRQTNLCIVNYSASIDKYLEFDELKSHLHSLPSLPTAIPYVTSYYSSNWGFCVSHEVLEAMPKKGKYYCFIDSEHTQGNLEYGHLLLNGGCNEKEVLLTSYLCHPSLANNELSGPLVLVGLYERLKNWKFRRFNYRFYIGPETIGALCFLSDFGDLLQSRTMLGLVLTCLGGKNDLLSVKLPKNKNSFAFKYLSSLADLRLRNFTPDGGSDERQFCSPGFNLPVANICRDVYGDYDGYHSSLDTKEYMSIEAVTESVDRIERLLIDFESNCPFERVNPYGEPQLGKRNLYPNTSSRSTWNNSSDEILDNRELRKSIMWLLSYSDGENPIQYISELSGCTLSSLSNAAKILCEKKLLK